MNRPPNSKVNADILAQQRRYCRDPEDCRTPVCQSQTTDLADDGGER